MAIATKTLGITYSVLLGIRDIFTFSCLVLDAGDRAEKKLGWQEGMELDGVVAKDTYLLRRKGQGGMPW